MTRARKKEYDAQKSSLRENSMTAEDTKAIVKALGDLQIEMRDLISEVIDKLDQITKLLQRIEAQNR